MGQCVTRPVHRVHPPSTVTADQVKDALNFVAGYLEGRRTSATLVAVGGIVDVLHLKLRDVTDDIEFLGPAVSNWQNLRTALELACAHVGIPPRILVDDNSVTVGENWISIMSHLQPDQRMVIYKSPGLEVIAAPWEYGLCVKLDLLQRGASGAIEPKMHHVTDAAIYLHHLTRSKPPSRPYLTLPEIRRMMSIYYLACSDLAVPHSAPDLSSSDGLLVYDSGLVVDEQGESRLPEGVRHHQRITGLKFY